VGADRTQIVTTQTLPQPMLQNDFYACATDQSGGPITLTLPQLTVPGIIWVADIGYNAAANNIIVQILPGSGEEIALDGGFVTSVTIKQSNQLTIFVAEPGLYWRCLPQEVDNPFGFTGTGATVLQNSPTIVDPILNTPTATTPGLGDNSQAVATTAWVKAQNYGSGGGVQGVVAGAGLAGGGGAGIVTVSVATAGVTNAMLATVADNTTPVATEGYVAAQAYAPLASPALTGTPTAPTPTLGDSSTKVATTQFVMSELGTLPVGVTTFNGRSGAITLTTADVTGAGGAPLASPTLTGTPQAPTAAAGTNSQQIATTAFVATSFLPASTAAATYLPISTAAATYAPIANPTFTGTVTIPAGASIAGYATTAQLGNYMPISGGNFTGGVGMPYLHCTGNTNLDGATYFTNASVDSGGNASFQGLSAGSITCNPGTIASQGSNAGFSFYPRNGSGSPYMWYNPGSNGGAILWSGSTGASLLQISDSAMIVPAALNTQHYGACYFGNGNQSYFNNTGGLYIANGQSCLIGGWGVQYFSMGAGGHYNAFGWNGTNVTFYVDGTYEGYVGLISDARIKENVEPAVEDSLALLEEVETFRFDVPPRHLAEGDTADTRHFEAGFIGQQLREIMPDAAIEQEDLITIEALPLLARCVRAIQQLNDKVKALEARARSR